MMDIYRDKVCVITGAASGMGRELARQLDAAGAVLALSDVNEDGLAETRALLGAGNRILTDRLDVSDKAAVAAYADTVEAAIGPADFVFNNAGLSRIGPVTHTDLDAMETIMDVNFWGVARMTKAFLPQLIATRGVVTNISSLFGLIAFPGQAAYCASKFAVRGFTETLALEMEEMGTGVGVCCVHPGGIQTPIARNVVVDHLPDGQSHDDLIANFDQMAITPVDVAVKTILSGTARRRKQIIIGKDAKIVSWLQRLMPLRYVKVMARYTKDRGIV